MPQASSGGMEADPGLVGQFSDPLRPQQRRESAKHAWQPPGRHHRDTAHDDLAPGDLGTVDGRDRHHGHPRVGGRTWAAWSASNDTACRVGARG